MKVNGTQLFRHQGLRSLYTFVFCFPAFLLAQDLFPVPGEVYRDDIVARVDVILPADSLAVILAPGNEESDYHFHATCIFDNGTIRDTFTDIGFRLRGNTSRHSAKKSFKISLNTYVPGRTWHGVEKLNLNGEHNDPTVSRSKVCWDLLREIGVPAPRANHVRLYINNNYYGLYANTEHIDEEFVMTRFGNNDGNLYKCLWPADLAYLGDDPDLYKLTSGDRRVYELGTNEEQDDYSDLAEFIDILNNTPLEELPCALESIFNVNTYLKAMAFDILSGNWDGPLFNKNNFYLYHNEATGLFEYIPYDLDNTFGIDWFGIDWAQRDMYSWGNTSEPRPLYNRILAVPEYRSRFSYYMNTILARVYKESVLFPRLDALKSQLAPYVEDDPYFPLDYGFSLDDFNNGFGQTLPYFHTKSGIKPFIASRRSATINQLELTDIAPIISSAENNHPGTGDMVIIAAIVEDDLGLGLVQLCFQSNGPVTCETMRDDGMGPDSIAGDGIYTIALPPFDAQTILQYTIQATDITGQTSEYPVCGSRELTIGSSAVTLAVNEFMADNDGINADEAGEFEDWVEIYNYGTDSVYLGDLYLSDKQDNPTKWQFPDLWMQPDCYLLIWADEDGEQGDLHANFKLSADGEFVGIFDNDDNGNVLIDGIAFGPQETDIAFGRYPNGTGPWMVLVPTPGSANALPSLVSEEDSASSYLVYPNPVHGTLYIQGGANEVFMCRLYDAYGNVIEKRNGYERVTVDLSRLSSGIYFVGIYGLDHRVHVKKIVLE